MELRSKNEIKGKVLGKYINCSGLDQILVDTETYGASTLSQILNGNYIKRDFKAHMTLYLSLSNLLSTIP